MMKWNISQIQINELMDKFDNGDHNGLLLKIREIVVNEEYGMQKLADLTGLGRESLYKTFSNKSTPRLLTFMKIFKALGLKVHISLIYQPERSKREDMYIPITRLCNACYIEGIDDCCHCGR